MLETSPMAPPTANRPPRSGSSRDGFGFLSMSVCVAKKAMKTPKKPASSDVDMLPTICGPTSEPTTIPGAIPATTFHITAPWR